MSAVSDQPNAATSETTVRRDERRAAAVSGGAHALHDGYTDLIYVLLPLWQAEFGLGFAELGILRGVFVGTMASLQIPCGLLANRFGTAKVLAIGTALTGLGFCVAGLSTGFALLLLALFIGGLGSSAQHPLASTLVSRAFAGVRSMKALGLYNFSGDIGKMTVPAAAALLLTVMPWRPSLVLLGVVGLFASVAIYQLTPRYDSDAAPKSSRDDGANDAERSVPHRFGFPVLLSIGVID